MEQSDCTKFFWIDPKRNVSKSYSDLLNDINALREIPRYLKDPDTYQLYVKLLAGMLTDDEYILLDADWSENELQSLGITSSDLIETVSSVTEKCLSIDDLLRRIQKQNGWRLGFFTSGTTGRPKYIAHNMTVLSRNVKTGERFSENNWGFCYNPTHFAGIQVFLQAIYNKNTIINLFYNDYVLAEDSIKKYAITHLSATPTYYRSIFSYLKGDYPLVQRITFGGEMFDTQAAQKVKNLFPNAKITNVYASTELGSILAGQGDTLKIPEKFADRIRISDGGELQVHKSLMGEIVDEWFSTGDLVEIKQDGTLQFVSRKSEMINVGGYKVNPHEIEDAIKECMDVCDVVVYGRENRITGKLIVADIKITEGISHEIFEEKITQYLSSKLQPWKIPRIIRVVDEIDHTRTGKKVRK